MTHADILICLMFAHWIADFLCQTRVIAENKSKSIKILSIHVAIYTSIVTLAFAFFNPENLIGFFLANFVLHWITDFITSRITTYFYLKENMYGFFSTIGFDQYIHLVCLYWTSYYFIMPS